MKFFFQTTVLYLFFASSLSAQSKDLRSQLASIISKHDAKVGIAVKCLENGSVTSLNNNFHYPMQSVYKFPLAMAVLHKVDEGTMTLNQKVHIAKNDLRKTWSPIRDKFPEGNIDLTLAELLEYSVSESDNNACDILFRLIGGPQQANKYLSTLGFSNIKIVATEREMQLRENVQYANWATPEALIDLLEGFHQGKYLTKTSNDFLMKIMIATSTGSKRIKGLLPKNVTVAHKTGTSGINNKRIFAATNDVGIITLPDGKHIALVVLVSQSKEKNEDTEALIAQIAKATYDYYLLK